MLKKPRIVMLMVRAGTAVDEMIAQLVPFLEPETSSSMEETQIMRIR